MVLNGMEGMQGRADESAKVLDYGYREFGLYPIAKAGDVMASPTVWLGTAKNLPIVAGEDAVVTLPRSARSGLKAVVAFAQPLAAPIKKGQQVGLLTITAPGMDAKVVPVVASQDVAEVGFLARVKGRLGLIFSRKKA
jgi:D-alanyl-D-alanine carboxypeptidase (penicillin-binding protein 5/6)